MPSTSAPRSSSSRAITSTSPIRGTLVRTHSSSVSRQAARIGSAAFLLPSTATRPSSRCPPSMSSVDISPVLSSEIPHRGSASNPTKIGSGRNHIPKRSPTPCLTARASRNTSAAVAPPRFTSASGCFVEMPTAPSAWPLRKSRSLDQPRRRYFHPPVAGRETLRPLTGDRRDPFTIGFGDDRIHEERADAP